MLVLTRNSDRIIGGSVIINEGWGSFRGTRMTDVYAQGIRLVDATTPGAQLFTNPYTGATAWRDQPPRGRPSTAAAKSAYGQTPYLNS